jgi:hypothetical protein
MLAGQRAALQRFLVVHLSQQRATKHATVCRVGRSNAGSMQDSNGDVREMQTPVVRRQ